MATVQGVFDQETFTAVPDANATLKFDAVHQYHLGLWFNDPQVPFNLHCEGTATAPKVTVFNGEQHARASRCSTPATSRTTPGRDHVHPLSTTH